MITVTFQLSSCEERECPHLFRDKEDAKTYLEEEGFAVVQNNFVKMEEAVVVKAKINEVSMWSPNANMYAIGSVVKLNVPLLEKNGWKDIEEDVKSFIQSESNRVYVIGSISKFNNEYPYALVATELHEVNFKEEELILM